MRKTTKNPIEVCQRKRRWVSLKNILKYIGEKAQFGTQLMYYKCEVCRGYHLTSNGLFR